MSDTNEFMLYSPTASTYEATKARQSIWAQPDKIHWSKHQAYRNSPYRQLHHQKGLVGSFQVKLLEAHGLKRSYWSALALGPVKHFGLSKAHGAISSFASLKIHNHVHRSPVVANNNHPVWNDVRLDFPLKKGSTKDGEPILLEVELVEDATAAEQLGLPGVPSPQDRQLGKGTLDLTPLCLGQDLEDAAHVGVLDVWIPIRREKKDDNGEAKKLSSNEDSSVDMPVTGRVRVLVTYTRHGLDPQPNDLVALEAFARRSVIQASCRPLLPPLLPMRVLQERHGFLLVEYSMSQRQATMRLHRNAVFVIERTNLVDGVVNAALLPVDFVMATPLGRTTAHVAGPVVEAAGEMVQPLVLSSRLLWTALRTTVFASMTGVQAATHAVWRESKDAQERRNHQASFVQHNDDDDGSRKSEQKQHSFV